MSLTLRSTQTKKAEEPFLSRGLAPSFHVIFYVICFFNTREHVTKRSDCESLEISQENVYGVLSFSKVTSLQCSGCNFTIKRIHRRFCLEHVPKS